MRVIAVGFQLSALPQNLLNHGGSMARSYTVFLMFLPASVVTLIYNYILHNSQQLKTES